MVVLLDYPDLLVPTNATDTSTLVATVALVSHYIPFSLVMFLRAYPSFYWICIIGQDMSPCLNLCKLIDYSPICTRSDVVSNKIEHYTDVAVFMNHE